MRNPNLRIERDVTRGPPLSFQFDGKPIAACEGETVAAALLASGIRNLRNQSARGMMCAMGICQECLVRVDGQLTESCRLIVHDGLVVESIP